MKHNEDCRTKKVVFIFTKGNPRSIGPMQQKNSKYGAEIMSLESKQPTGQNLLKHESAQYLDVMVFVVNQKKIREISCISSGLFV